MGKYIKSETEVEQYLKRVYDLINQDGKTHINNQPWKDGKVNKTRQYMDETGIKRSDMINVVRELKVENYSSTKDDRNINFIGEQVWEFGITKNLIDCDEKLYIKLKIRKFEDEELLIMSFHPEQPRNEQEKLQFPYRKENK